MSRPGRSCGRKLWMFFGMTAREHSVPSCQDIPQGSPNERSRDLCESSQSLVVVGLVSDFSYQFSVFDLIVLIQNDYSPCQETLQRAIYLLDAEGVAKIRAKA